MRTATVTCHTDGCAKDGQAVPGVPITIEDEDGNETRVGVVTCGVCAQPIDDVVED